MKREFGNLYVGCAGYQYADWIGPVYPPATRPAAMLEAYAHYFSCVELNFSYYRMPTAETLHRIASKAPQLKFAIKAHQSMTHARDADAGAFLAYRAALAPLIETGQLLACLLQFPYSFKRTPAALHWLQHLRDSLPEVPLVAEFRTASWVDPTVLPVLRQLEIGWCAVDEPQLPGLMPPLAAITSPIGYARFHGRNAAQWYEHEHAWQRYDYRYSEEELRSWLPRIERLMASTEQTVVILNNHYRGQAVEAGQMLIDLLPEHLHEHLIAPSEPMPRVESRDWREST